MARAPPLRATRPGWPPQLPRARGNHALNGEADKWILVICFEGVHQTRNNQYLAELSGSEKTVVEQYVLSGRTPIDVAGAHNAARIHAGQWNIA